MKKILFPPIAAICLLTLAACGGENDDGPSGPEPTYAIGGSVSGLAGGGLVLQNNGGNDLSVGAGETSFIFGARVGAGAAYSVTVKDQPSIPNQTCTVNNGSGTVSGADVTSVSVICSTNAYTVGGTVTGLIGNAVSMQNNSADDLSVSTDSDFTFPIPVADTAGYSVTVKTPPEGQVCAITNGSGTIQGAGVTDVAVNCYTLKFGPRHSAAPNWNDYVKAADTNTACDGTETGGYSACIHGGERRELEVPGKASCDGLTASDGLGAFDWTCDNSTSPVKMVSTGLKASKNLSDLIDFDARAWKPNSVAVKDGTAEYLTTGPSEWWTNPIAVDNDGGTLGTAGTIYLFEEGASGAYLAFASSLGLVGRPGAILNSTVSPSLMAIGNFLWIEGSANREMNFPLLNFSVLRNVTVNNDGDSLNGVYLSGSSNKLTGVTAVNNSDYGIHLQNSSYNTLAGVTAVNNSYYGVYLQSSSNNTLSGVTAANNAISGVYLSGSSNNTLAGVMAVNNEKNGVHLQDSSYNTLKRVLAADSSQYGVYLQNSSYNTLSEAGANENNGGIYLSGSSNNTLNNIAASQNDYNVNLYLSSNNNYFTGLLTLKNSLSNHCTVVSSDNSGLVDGTCTETGNGGSNTYGIGNISDATFNYTGSTFSAVHGLSPDTANQSDNDNGKALYPADPSAFDWTNFDNPYRAWGKEILSGFRGVRGRWSSGYGMIYDWHLSNFGNFPVPTGDDTLTHLWSADQTACGNIPGAAWGGNVCSLPGYDTQTGCQTAGGDWTAEKCYSVFLRSAVEIQGDGIGNDNTLCESSETCLYTPKFGIYQGYGGLIDAGFTGGQLTGITLMKHEYN